MFQQNIYLGAEKDCQPNNVEPEHQDDHGTDAAVGGTVVGKVVGVGSEAKRRDDQDNKPTDTSRRDQSEPLLNIGRVAVDYAKAKQKRQDDHRPSKDGKEVDKGTGEVEASGEPGLDEAAENDEGKSTDH